MSIGNLPVHFYLKGLLLMLQTLLPLPSEILLIAAEFNKLPDGMLLSIMNQIFAM